MGFTLDDIVIDRVQYGYAEDLSGNPLYALTQLQDGRPKQVSLLQIMQ